MRSTSLSVLGAATIVAALGLSGCSGDDVPPPAASIETPAPITKPPTAPPPPTPPSAPLPAPTALTDVMYRLADPDVPGADKVGLVEYATADDAAALDRFGRALRDGGFMPLTFEAHDLTWSQGNQGNVVATIVIKTANEQADDFTFPMEFSPIHGSWQLTRQTADLLLQLGGETPTPTPTR